jgi:hypothetical protein
MTMRNVPIAIAFSVIAVSELGLGIGGATYAARTKGKYLLRTWKSYVSSGAPICDCACSHIATTDTPGRIPYVCNLKE